MGFNVVFQRGEKRDNKRAEERMEGGEGPQWPVPLLYREKAISACKHTHGTGLPWGRCVHRHLLALLKRKRSAWLWPRICNRWCFPFPLCLSLPLCTTAMAVDLPLQKQ